MDLAGEDDDSGDENDELVINEKFAASFEARESEKLAAAEGSSSSSSEESEDEGEELTPEMEGKIFDTILKIRNKDPKIYDKESVFFEEEPKVVRDKKEKPVLLRDVLLEKPADRFEYDQQQRDNRNEFREIDVDEDFELTTKSSRTEKVVIPQVEEFKRIGDADDVFLASLDWKRSERDSFAQQEEEEEDDVSLDEFENKYNFRFEQSTEIATHPRNLPSMRRKDERRKIKRKLAALRKQKVKQELGLDVDDDDFDPDRHEKIMAEYLEKTDDDDLEAKKPANDEAQQDEHDDDDGVYRFKYKSVTPNDFGLTTEEILDTDEADLKQLVPVKRLAPYRDSEFNVSSMKRKKWRQALAKKKREAAAKEEEEAAAAAAKEKSKSSSASKKLKKKKKKRREKDDDQEAAAKRKKARLKSYGL